jgi:hopanoid biosynthesis associated RND transporter like protein HpnN
LLSAILCVFHARARLVLETGQTNLMSSSSPAQRNYLSYKQEFPERQTLVVVIDRHDRARAKQFADDLAAHLRRDPRDVASVFYRSDSALAASAISVLDNRQLTALLDLLSRDRELLRAYASDPTLASFFRQVNRRMRGVMTERMMIAMGATRDPAAKPASQLGLKPVIATLEGMNASNAAANPQLPWDRFMAVHQGPSFDRGYLVSAGGNYLLMQIGRAGGESNAVHARDAVAQIVNAARARFRDVDAGLTGGPSLNKDLTTSTLHDLGIASALGVAANVILLVVSLGGLQAALILTSLLIGIAWSFGFITLAVGHLNFLSAAFVSILIGIGVNFSIHLMARFDEARSRGKSPAQALARALIRTGNGVVASCIAMSFAFLIETGVGLKAVAELALPSAAGLILCCVAALLVLPSLIALRPFAQSRTRSALSSNSSNPKNGSPVLGFPDAICAFAAVLTVIAACAIGRVHYDGILLNLQPRSGAALRFAEKLRADGDRGQTYAVALAKSSSNADLLAAQFRKAPEVAAVETLSDYLPNGDNQRLQTLAQLRAIVDPIRVSDVPISRSPVALALEIESLKANIMQFLGAHDRPELSRANSLLGESILRMRRDPDVFFGYDRAMAAGFRDTFIPLKRAIDAAAVSPEAISPELRARFIGHSGSYLVRIYPRDDIATEASRERFVNAIRAIDPEVTGGPVFDDAIANSIRRGCTEAAVLALLAVVIYLLFDLRSTRDTALAIAPLLLGGIWTLGIMGLAGWSFNPANLFALPVIIGTGVDNGVNLIYRWREEGRNSRSILRTSIGKSMTVSSLTTIAGFAALTVASSHALASLGAVLCLGAAMILLTTIVVMPALLHLVTRPPATIVSARKSVVRVAQTEAQGAVDELTHETSEIGRGAAGLIDALQTPVTRGVWLRELPRDARRFVPHTFNTRIASRLARLLLAFL